VDQGSIDKFCEWLGHLDRYLPDKFKSDAVLGREVPAETEPAAR
jgi:hypothetical protein